MSNFNHTVQLDGRIATESFWLEVYIQLLDEREISNTTTSENTDIFTLTLRAKR